MNYNFRVYLVSDGVRSGLLLTRKKGDDPHPVTAYFWFDDDAGLYPTTEMKKHCDGGCHKLECAKKYDKQLHKSARCRDQELIFRELMAFTRTVAAHPDTISLQMDLTQNYEHASKGYPEVLSRFFAKPRTPFADFFVNLGVFTECVLKNLYGNQKIVGRAEEFAFQDHRNIFPNENLKYFLTAEQLLEAKNPPPAEWFRKTGPVISDFEDRKVYRRKIVEQFKEIVLGNQTFLIEGDAATGKTVIVRTLLYDFYKEGNKNIYYFDIASMRSFNEADLMHEMQINNGIFIIENIHLEPQKAQWIYLKSGDDFERHIVFTSRPSFPEFQNKYSKDLKRIHGIVLTPFDQVEELIDWFCAHHTTPAVVADKRKQILEISKNSFWLLAYALQGCATAQGKGDPISWIGREVNTDLCNMENCGEIHASQYPCILLALSPLYKNEVLTAECYLLDKFRFSKAAINELVKRGEITRQQSEKGIVYYGLPHSALADAFWVHGERFKRLMAVNNYEDFIYDYSLSKAPNCLDAVTAANQSIRNILLNRLEKNNKLKKVIAQETSMGPVAKLAKDIAANSKYLPNNEVLAVIAEKIMITEDFGGGGYCIYQLYKSDKLIGQKFWNLINVREFAERLSKTENYLNAWGCINCIYEAHKPAAKQLCDLLNENEIVPRIMQTQGNIKFKCDFLLVVNKASPKKGETLLSKLDCERLALNLSNIENIRDLFAALFWIFLANRNIGENIWKNLLLETLTKRLIDHRDFWTIVSSLRVLNRFDHAKAFELSCLLPQKSLVELVKNFQNKDYLNTYIQYLSRINKTLADSLKKYI